MRPPTMLMPSGRRSSEPVPEPKASGRAPKRAAIVVAPAVDDVGIFANPGFEPALLLGTRGALLAVAGNDGRLEMIGQGKDQVHGAASRRVQRAPGCGRQDLSCVGDLVF